MAADKATATQNQMVPRQGVVVQLLTPRANRPGLEKFGFEIVNGGIPEFRVSGHRLRKFCRFRNDWVVDARSTHLERLLKVSDSRSEDSQ